MTLNESKELIAIINSYLEHDMYSDYSITSSTGTNSTLIENAGKAVLLSVIDVFQTAINAINKAMTLLYNDDEIQNGKDMNFLKINAYSEMYRENDIFQHDKKMFVNDDTHAYTSEILYNAVKLLDTEHIYNGGNLEAFKAVLDEFIVSYEQFIPIYVPPQGGNAGNTTPKQHQFWITSDNVTNLKNSIKTALPKGTTF